MEWSSRASEILDEPLRRLLRVYDEDDEDDEDVISKIPLHTVI